MRQTPRTYDNIEKFHRTVIHHGPYNSRIYLMKMYEAEAPDIIKAMDEMAQEKGYGKILAKVPGALSSFFEQEGYGEEANIPGFSRGTGDMVFMAKYFSPERRLEKHHDQIKQILEIAQKKTICGIRGTDEHEDMVRRCTPSDAREISSVYQRVFRTYPFPIHDPEYLMDTMGRHIYYFCVREGKEVIALASSEMDTDSLSAEMMDFATLPDWRRQGLACRLLSQMERQMKRRGMLTAYTIARALSPGMNITFAKMGYHYAGTLKNNSNISGRIESMNVWYKSLENTVP
ncbi:MAG: putative beta-lysine N-acetyltransferase [Desulfobacteraceae bacterium]|nr:MAG: putative beta-lysine N-acetyltransferase [Desulfobacteraceae bacterium]